MAILADRSCGQLVGNDAAQLTARVAFITNRGCCKVISVCLSCAKRDARRQPAPTLALQAAIGCCGCSVWSSIGPSVVS